jgi:hypothetical protein
MEPSQAEESLPPAVEQALHALEKRMVLSSVHNRKSLDDTLQQYTVSSRDHLVELCRQQEATLKEFLVDAAADKLKTILPTLADRFDELEAQYTQNKLPLDDLRVELERHMHSLRDKLRLNVLKIAKEVIPVETKAHMEVGLKRLGVFNQRLDMFNQRLDSFEKALIALRRDAEEVSVRLANWRLVITEDAEKHRHELQSNSDANWEKMDAAMRDWELAKDVTDAKSPAGDPMCRQALTAMLEAMQRTLGAGAPVDPQNELPPLGTPGAGHIRTIVELIRSRTPPDLRRESALRLRTAADPCGGAPRRGARAGGCMPHLSRGDLHPAAW